MSKLNLTDLGFSAFTTRASVPVAKEDEVDFTIIIAHRGPALGLWATVQSCEIELADSSFKYNYVIVPNGPDKWSNDEERVWQYLQQTHKVRDLIKVPRPLSPPSARNMGAEMANGKYLFFLDNHCLVAKNYFSQAMATLESRNIDVLHSRYRYYAGDKDHWHYEMTLKANFWGEALTTEMKAPFATEPYRCAASGHGGFAVRRSAWKEMGGYWEGFVGYGGEEMYFDLGMWLMGKEVWVDPKMIHYHFAGERGYERHYSDLYYKNMMMVANIIGGREWMESLHDNFNRSVRKKSDKTMFDLMDEAYLRSKDFAAQFAARRILSLDTLLEQFVSQQIPH